MFLQLLINCVLCAAYGCLVTLLEHQNITLYYVLCTDPAASLHFTDFWLFLFCFAQRFSF